MRVRSIPLLVLLLASTAFSPQMVVGQSESGIKYWIMFDGGKEPSEIEASVTDRARRRRARRGHDLSSEVDKPVSPKFISLLSDLGIRTVHTSRWLNAASAVLSPDQAANVVTLPFVASIRPVGSSSFTESVEQTPTATTKSFAANAFAPRGFEYGASFTQLSIVNAIGNLESGINGTGVRFGLIDTGIGDQSHPALSKMISEGRFIESRDFTGFADDGSRHGLGVLTIATGFTEGTLIGPAYGVEVLHARTEYVPTESRQEEDNMVAALEWMESQGVDVINISLGYSTFDDASTNYTYDDMNGESTISTRAVETAIQLGVVVVSSAGNEGALGGSECSPQTCWYYITSPADALSNITVGATNSSGIKAAFSSFGPTSDGRIKPDVSAMGVLVVFGNASNGFSTGNGTSFSSPMVAGVVAQMLQVNPNLSPIEVRDILRQTARIPTLPDSLNIAFPNNRYGWGIIDAGAATSRATSVATPAEIPTSLTISEPYPNPATNRVSFNINRHSKLVQTDLHVFDLLGREFHLPVIRMGTGRSSRLDIQTRSLQGGVYLYRVTVGDKSATGIFTILQ